MKLCPECLTPLEHKKHKIFHCSVCPEGHGTLYPRGELESIAKALSGLGDLEMKIWTDHEQFSVVNSHLKSPDSGELLQEIRDRDVANIMVYGDPLTHSLWLHTGEEEKLVEHITRAANADSVSAYLKVAADEAIGIFDDEADFADVTGHMVTALKLLGERILRAMPLITLGCCRVS